MINTYLTDIATIKENSVIDENIPDKLIYSTLMNVQELYLEPLLGTSFYQTLLSGFTTNSQGQVICTLSPLYKSLIDQKITKFLIAGVVYMLADNIMYKYTSRGINKEKGQYAETIQYKEIEAFKKGKLEIFDLVSSKLRLFLEINRADYPEFYDYWRDSFNSFENTENSFYFYCDTRINPSFTMGKEINPAYGLYNSGFSDEYYDSQI